MHDIYYFISGSKHVKEQHDNLVKTKTTSKFKFSFRQHNQYEMKLIHIIVKT